MKANLAVDDALLKEIEEARTTQAGVQAVFSFDPKATVDSSYLSASQTVEHLLKRVSVATGEKAKDFNVFGNLNAFVLEAPANFVQAMLEQDEIVSAVANQGDSEDPIR